ncbi:hypothetical protein M427DRAFT_258814 [Gonapodya prolifera JEL478]|uniref:Uncharacterized protein n=1 Tax=Gonapodya prolifera (strain JEL478) TaxID=1344416 RepID=A0A138ZY11_GONPJ|nr:hypothetical protein M427DRAFT_258814 [Gonapodya prolifera JEL478]|eukprot:KXS09023.1 hypothetical protein M427DRAFT_258814 [Gonapodya prolifera JEL478]
MHVNLIKSVWISGQITRNVLDGQKNYSKKLVEELERSFTRSTSANKGDQNVASAPPSQQAPPPSSTLSVAQFNIVTQLFPLGRTVTLSAILCILIAVLLMASRAPWVMVASPRIEMSPLCDGNCQLARTLADLSGNALYVRRLEDELRETRATICRMEARLRALERSHV